MNRTDRLYALVEELRAVTPRPRSATWLAQRFEVSTRTVERDLSALQASGMPIHAEPGRLGGYVLDRSVTMAPTALTTGEATALTVALHTLAGTPFATDARRAVQKVLAQLPERDRTAMALSLRRIGFLDPEPPRVPLAISEALSTRRVLRVVYRDREGGRTSREVEPLGFLGAEHWYLVVWCRLRQDVRGLRLDRIGSVDALGEVAPAREIDLERLDVYGGDVRLIGDGWGKSPPKHRQGAVATSVESGYRQLPTERSSR